MSTLTGRDVSRTYGHHEEIVLPDGGLIELRRLGAAVASGLRHDASRVPVLLVHGLAMNHHNHDTADRASFARYLHGQERDVWLLTLRSGRSRPRLFGPAHHNFAAMVKYDLPHAVESVLTHTGEPRLDVAAFSMGGMLLYAGLDRTLDSRLVRRVAFFASPAKVRALGLLNLSRSLPAALSPTLPMRFLMRVIACAPRWLSRVICRRLYNAHNLERVLERQMLWNVWEDIPGPLGSDFVRFSSRGGEIVVAGEPVLPGLARVSVPACFFAGAADWLAPPWAVRAGFDAWGRALPAIDKHFLVLGAESGTRHEYGHCDMCCGRYVREEVFEPAARFLATGVFRAARSPEQAAPSTEIGAATPA